MASQYQFNYKEPSLLDKFLDSKISFIASTWLLRISLLILIFTIGIHIGSLLERKYTEKIMNEIIVVNKDNQILKGKWINDKKIYQLNNKDQGENNEL